MQYVLVHGAWQGGWCWEFLASELSQRGHKVSCPDFPGQGSHPFPLHEVTYDVYYQFLKEEINKYHEKVVLIAHSLAGTVCAPLFDEFPDRISHLFLIAAFVAQDGNSLLDMALAGGPSELPKLLITDEKNKTQSLDLSNAKVALYHDCPDEIAEWAISRLKPQPMSLFTTPIFWKDSGKTKNRRTYVLCEEDRDVHITTQKNVLKEYPSKTVSLKAGHFPFLSQPKQLADIIEKF